MRYGGRQPHKMQSHVYQQRASSLEKMNRELRAALRERDRELSSLAKAETRDKLDRRRLDELRGRIDALRCANFFLREHIKNNFKC